MAAQDLISAYLEECERCNAPIEDMDAFKAATLYCLAYPLTGGAAIDPNFKRSGALLDTMLQRSFAAVEAYGCLELIS